MPSHKKAIKIVTPTAKELQDLFLLSPVSEVEGVRSESPQTETVATPLVHYNDCIVALDVIFDEAEKGSSCAIECLRIAADIFVSNAMRSRGGAA